MQLNIKYKNNNLIKKYLLFILLEIIVLVSMSLIYYSLIIRNENTITSKTIIKAQEQRLLAGTITIVNGDINDLGYNQTFTTNNGYVYNEYKQDKGYYSEYTYVDDTIKGSGCGLISVCIVASGYGIEIGQVLEYALDATEYGNAARLTEIGFVAGEDYIDYGESSITKQELVDQLKSGRPTINRVGATSNPCFTGHTHYVALLAYDEGNDEIYVSNPYSTLDNGWWPADDVMAAINAGGNCHHIFMLVDPTQMGAVTSDEDEGNLLINAIVSLVNSILDAIQNLISKIMMDVTSHQASVLIADDKISDYDINLETSDEKPSWWKSNEAEEENEGMESEVDGVIDDGNDYETSFYVDVTNFRKKYKYVNLIYSPEEIFKNLVPLLNINFFETGDSGTLWGTLRNVIAYWFRALRYIGLAGLLAVLIYMGINIMTSSVNKKSKYKELVLDWIVGMFLMFMLPYIMSFTVNVSEQLTDIFTSSATDKVTVYAYDDGEHAGKSMYAKFDTNLMGLVRFQAQTKTTGRKIAFTVMYLMLVVYTVKFTILYVKRMVMMAYLTMIAPIVALMYPIDKANDGSAQSFGEWLKGYMVNALLQPIHLLIYYILVGSAITFASENIIYVIVILGFMSQLENIVRKIFGLEPQGLGQIEMMKNLAVGSAVASTATGLLRKAKNVASAAKGNKDTSSDKKEDDDTGKFDFANFAGRLKNKENDSTEDKEKTGKDTILPNFGGKSQDGNKRDETSSNGGILGRNKNNKANDTMLSGNDTVSEGLSRRGALKQMAYKRVKRTGHRIGYRKGAGIRGNALNITKAGVKKGGKIAIKGAKTGVSVGAGVAAATVVGAFNAASTGKFSLAGATGAFATGAMVTNKGLNVAGKLGGRLKNTTPIRAATRAGRYDKKQIESEERAKYFRESKQAYKMYENRFLDKGSGELDNRLKLGEQLAADGITSGKEQMKVMNYMDSMIDNDYARMSYVQRRKHLDEARQDNSLNGMSDEEAIKWNMRKNNLDYREMAVNTSKAKQAFAEEGANIYSDERFNAWAKSKGGNIEDYKKARESVLAFNEAQKNKIRSRI